MKRFLIGVLTYFFASVSYPLTTLAAENFHLAIITDYTFADSGKSHVRQQISLTNETSHLYANSYQLTIAGDTPQNLTGFDSSGPLNITVSPQKDSPATTLNIVFNTPVVGKGSTQRFTLDYDSVPATKNGQVWEIALPKLAQPQLVDTYILNLQVPASFGTPAFITPQPSTSPSTTTPGIYSFTKDQLNGSGVVAAFGHLQTYSFKLSYSLSNPENRTAVQVITLPPDTAYQKIYYEDLSPHPNTVTVDADGNWLAEFTLAPKQNQEITATGQVRIYANPGPAPVLPPSQALEEYLRPPNSAVPPTDPTDLVISQARSNGTPARKLLGIVYTPNSPHQLRSWPEYWDTDLQTWITTDFTSQADADHFVLAINGLDLTSPQPDQSSIQLELDQYRNHDPQFPEVSLKKPFAFLPFLTNRVYLEINNNQGRAIYHLPINISSQGLNLASDPSTNPALLPPFSKIDIPITFRRSFFPGVSPLLVNVSLADRSLTYNIPQRVFFVWYGIIIIISSGLILGLAAIAVHAGGLYLQRPGRHDHLRRQGQKPQK